MSNVDKAQVVYVQQPQKSHGCLMTAVVFLLFGWIGLAVMAAWKLTKVAWTWTITVGWRWPVALCRAAWRGSVAATRAVWPHALTAGKAFHARYGAKGWAILGGVVLVLAVLGAVLGNH